MPRPVGRGQRYMPGLDGLRAVAVGGVVLYHLGVSWLPGGMLGVGVFFTLSGYLITDLLLAGREGAGRFALGEFWLRRARRLLPALVVLLVVVVTWVAVGDPAELDAVRAAALSGLLYVNNWWAIGHHLSYFARFGPPSPLGNLWSLSVEEQFYLIWPWVVAGAMFLVARGRRSGSLGTRGHRRARLVLAAVVLVLAAASAMEMAALFHPSLDPTRVYDGTDTRAFALLVGAALAFVWPSSDRRPVSWRGTVALDVAGLAGLGVIGVLMWRTDEYAAFSYRGGMVLVSVATALVVLSATHPSSHVGRALGLAPLRWIGLVSYGIYLWHYPIIVLTTPSVTPGGTVRLTRAVLQVGATVAIAALSWYAIESPVRRGALGRIWTDLRSRRLRLPGGRRASAGAGVLALSGVAALAFAGELPAAPVGTLAASGPSGYDVAHVLPSSKVIDTRPAGLGAGPAASRTPPATRGSREGSAVPFPGRLTRAVDPGGSGGSRAPTLATSCTSVVHLGDSTSESLVSSTYLPAAQQLPPQYARVGVQRVILEISGARSLVETLPGQVNGTAVARQLVAQGYRGCWVVALGTNDAANIGAGSSVHAATRIDTLMSVLHGQPVMWVETVSELTSGPYAEANMSSWDQALVKACAAFPTMRVYDWPSVVKPAWFISDGVHYNSAGSATRAAGFADALATAFPRAGSGATSSPVVSPHGAGAASPPPHRHTDHRSCVVR